MTTIENTLPAAPRHRIRWLQRLAVAGSVGAVLLLLGLVWRMLPAWLDPAQPSPVTDRLQHTVAVGTCAREFIAEWRKLKPGERESDIERHRLDQQMEKCSNRLPDLLAVHLLKIDEAAKKYTLVLSLLGVTEAFSTPEFFEKVHAAKDGDEFRAPSGCFTDRLYPVDSALVLVERYRLQGDSCKSGVTDAVPTAVRQEQWLLSALALGLVALVGVSLRWLGRSQRDYQQTLRQALADREAVTLKLNEEATLRRDIEDSISVGLRVVDREGRLTYVNRAFCETSGWTAQALMVKDAAGQPQYPYWPEDQAPRLAEHLHEILAGNARPESYRVPFVRPDGTRWTAQVSARALGSGEGWILASTDVTSEDEAQRRIASLNEDLRHQSTLELIGEHSGELLHKLSNQIGAAQLALGGVATNLQAGRHGGLDTGVQIAVAAVNQLSKTVEHFGGPVLRGEIAQEPSLLHATVTDAMVQVSVFAATHNVVMHNGISKELPPITMNRTYLREVLSNLLHNAISVMDTTPITNRLIVVENYLDEAAGQVQIHVRDRGPGIEPSQREAVFERHYSKRPGGSGWGLYLCRRWVHRLGGRLEVTDNHPRGADFVITLHLTPTEDALVHDEPTQPVA